MNYFQRRGDKCCMSKTKPMTASAEQGRVPMWDRGGLARELPNQTSKPWSYAANAWEPVTPLDTQPMEVSKTPCMKNTTSRAPAHATLGLGAAQ